MDEKRLLEILQGCIICVKQGILTVKECLQLINTLLVSDNEKYFDDLVDAESKIVKDDFLENI